MAGHGPEAMRSLDTVPSGNANIATPVSRDVPVSEKVCPKRFLVWEQCGHSNSRFKWSGCGSPRCEVCLEGYLLHGLNLEIEQAMKWCREHRRTLKFVTLTFQKDNPASFNTPDGARLRRLHLQKLIQKMRRQKIDVEYLRATETHQSGRVHMHLLMTLPHFDQGLLSDWWKSETGDSGVVWINSVFMKCPDCWDKRLSRKAKERRKIIPWPGSNRCGHCGYRPASADDVAKQAALEIGKYLAKNFKDAPGVKVLTRSEGWKQFKREADARGKGDGERVACEVCDVVHEHTVIMRERRTGLDDEWTLEAPGVIDPGRVWAWGFNPQELAVDGLGGVLWQELPTMGDGRGVAFHPPEGWPCRCWGKEMRWVRCPGVVPGGGSVP